RPRKSAHLRLRNELMTIRVDCKGNLNPVAQTELKIKTSWPVRLARSVGSRSRVDQIGPAEANGKPGRKVRHHDNEPFAHGHIHPRCIISHETSHWTRWQPQVGPIAP